MTRKRVAILGATGSIGTQALQIIQEEPQRFEAYLLTAHSNYSLLIEQAKLFRPAHIVITNSEYYHLVKDALASYPTQVHTGTAALEQLVCLPEIDIVLAAMVGFAGLRPTLAALEAGKEIALANKETLVVAGEIIIQKAREKGVRILPVDSEHSAIFQCLIGEEGNTIEKILLTASGGPFLHTPLDQMVCITPAEALRHPKWSMGAKITIDSATMMNKGLEMIEACHLFNVKPEEVQIVVHPQSYIHSMVQFQDGVIKAQIGQPDMRLPISYALGATSRIPNSYSRLDLFLNEFSFFAPDFKRFPCLTLSYEAMKRGGTAPCALNAANEVANAAFRKGTLSFTGISELIEKVLARVSFKPTPSLSDLFALHEEATHLAEEFL